MTFADLKKKPVVSMADGTRIGEISDLIIDPSRWTVIELYVDGQPGKGLLSFGDLKSIGPDAATVDRSDMVAYNAKASALSFEDMKHLHVVDGTGTARGEIVELNLDASGTIASFSIKQGGVFGIGAHHLTVTPAEIQGVGEKILTVDLPVPNA